MNSIKVGSYGWEFASFLQSFYPQDLPQEWRLSFYANEFNSILIPAELWCDSSLDIEEWLDVPDDFSFYLQQADAHCDERLHSVTQLLGSKLKGSVNLCSETICIENRVAIIESQQQSIREWRYWLEQNADDLDAIFLKDGDLSYQQLNDFKSLLELMGL